MEILLPNESPQSGGRMPVGRDSEFGFGFHLDTPAENCPTDKEKSFSHNGNIKHSTVMLITNLGFERTTRG